MAMNLFNAPQNLLLVGLCVALASYIQSLTGFAFGLIFLGLVSSFQLMLIPEATNVITLISLIQTVIYFHEFPLTSEWKVVRPAIWPSLAGVALGVMLLSWLSGNALHWLRITLGVAILMSGGLLLARVQTKVRLNKPGTFALTGLVSGLMSGMFSTGGPPMVYLLYRQPLGLEVIRQCMLVMFGIGQLVRLAIVVATGQFTIGSIGYALLAIPLVFLITKGHKHFPLGLSPAITFRIAAILLLITGTGLILSSIEK